MNTEDPNELIVPEPDPTYQVPKASPKRQYSPGLLGLAERLPGVNNSRTASAVLLVVALAAMLGAIFLLKGAFPVR